MPIFSGDGRAKRHLNDDLNLAQKEGYWKCKRCEGWYPKEEFFGVTTSQPDVVKEYQLCGGCRQGMRGSDGTTREQHEVRKEQRLAKKKNEPLREKAPKLYRKGAKHPRWNPDLHQTDNE